jgi:PhoPQ-activated pathogenicity-related protein
MSDIRSVLSLFAIAAGLMISAAAACRAQETPLDRYVAAPDAHYRWELLSTIPGENYTAYVLEMTSQQWRMLEEVDRPVWKHWLVIVRPDQVKTDIGLLVIGGGSNERPPPTRANPLLASLAVATGSVLSELRTVPNEPLTFAGETRKRSEDAIIAYSWDKYLKTGDETWPLRLPMTKAAVRAMDTITAFCGSPEGGGIAVDKFVVGGASKRGWTTWTTAAVDKRVVAIVPVVIDLLNIEPSFDHHYRAYGFWAPAVHDFAETGIMRWAGTPQFEALMKIEDPYAYRDRFTMPKFIVNSTGDQSFLPDSSQFYVDGLPGETYCAMCRIPITRSKARNSMPARARSPFTNRSSTARPGRASLGASRATARSASRRRRNRATSGSGGRPTPGRAISAWRR